MDHTPLFAAPVELTDAELDHVAGGQLYCFTPPGGGQSYHAEAACIGFENSNHSPTASGPPFCQCLAG